MAFKLNHNTYRAGKKGQQLIDPVPHRDEQGSDASIE